MLKIVKRENPSQANQTKRTTEYDGTSDLNRGSGNVVPYHRSDRESLLCPPGRLFRTGNNGGWDGRGIPPQAPRSQGQEIPTGNRGSRYSAQSGLDAAGLFRWPVVFTPLADA